MTKTSVTGLVCSLVLVALATGCNKTGGAAMSPAGKPPTVKGPQSPWEADPARAAEFTQALAFDKYQLSGPKSLVVDPGATKSNGKMNSFSWTIDSGADVPKVVLIATVTEDKKLVGEAQKNMKQALVNFTGGITNPYGLEPRRTTELETGSLAGVPFTRYKWNAKTKTGTRLEGLSYGGVDGGRSVLFVAMGFGQEAEANLALAQAVIATLKKQ